MDPNYVVEFMNDDVPAAPGEDGEIVLTHLDAWGMPLIRYRTGDVAQSGEGVCPCGRGFATMQNIRGRTTDFVVTPDGRWQHALSVIYIVRDIKGVDEFKIVQHALEDVQVLVRIIPALYPTDGDDRIRIGIRKRMGDSVNVRVEHVESIPRDASGKHRYVVSLVAQKGL
jgi:phenylacetate-CoA ligase